MNKIHFCPRCKNLLYPKEISNALSLLCKHCHYTAPTDTSTVYVNTLSKSSENKLSLVDPDLASDPTLPRAFDTICPNCQGTEAVFFMSRAGGAESDMALIFLCVNESCHHKWIN
eukprot:snap_masked-scaffold_5-processed-gene-2.26-mRNA-1 protein AED:0.02 eAED:0.02 QI:0/-1/0/1/-1/1/1/0/114